MLKRFVKMNRAASKTIAARYPKFFGYPIYIDELRGRIEDRIAEGVDEVLEAGGIDRPLLKRGRGFRYDGLDIDHSKRCDEVYDSFLVQSVEEPISGQYDLVISHALLEHVGDNTKSAQQIFGALREGGETHHYVPSKNHPYAIVTRLVGPRLQRALIRLVRPDSRVSGYPTKFNHCTPGSMKRLFERSGFSDVSVRAYYRANDYFAWFVPFFLAITLFENVCRAADWQYFASGYLISAHRGTAKPS